MLLLLVLWLLLVFEIKPVLGCTTDTGRSAAAAGSGEHELFGGGARPRTVGNRGSGGRCCLTIQRLPFRDWMMFGRWATLRYLRTTTAPGQW